MVLAAIDLNADLAEEAGDDEALYPFLSSANVCCGRHAGGPEAMTKAVQAAITQGATMKYVKPHGALYHRIGNDPEQAAAVIDAIAEINSELHVLVPDTEIIKSTAANAGLTVIHEFFADRAYLPEGTLVPRSIPDSVLHDADQISERVLSWLEHGNIAASDGSQISVDAKSICLHGDTPGAVASAESIYQRCKSAGYEIKSWMDN